ncbi:hypothetical protein C5167_024885 [Papaver somniferum]|uniref:Uncharacterized protein n=1 Tax=Papaver somniferum TaxID=3469 RepID=A0A4Y7JT74_PAPSO|nr:hypothetical protein C5167_024885 [Papaver somniferum]
MFSTTSMAIKFALKRMSSTDAQVYKVTVYGADPSGKTDSNESSAASTF